MSEIDRLVDEFRTSFEAGEAPDPATFLDRAPDGERQELEALIDRVVMDAPRRRWDPVAYEASPAKQAVDRAFESLDGVSGSWPELLPSLRDRARVKRAELVVRLAAALGHPARTEKVGDYYNRMEHGLLPAEGVSGRVIEALAEIVGASADAIRAAGSAGRTTTSFDSTVFMRRTLADEDYAAAEAMDAAPAPAGAPPPPQSPGTTPEPYSDEIDQLFTGG